MNGVLVQEWFTLGPLDPLANQVIISPGTEGRIGMDVCDNCQNTHIGSLVFGLRVIPTGKAKMENQKQ